MDRAWPKYGDILFTKDEQVKLPKAVTLGLRMAQHYGGAASRQRTEARAEAVAEAVRPIAAGMGLEVEVRPGPVRPCTDSLHPCEGHGSWGVYVKPVAP